MSARTVVEDIVMRPQRGDIGEADFGSEPAQVADEAVSVEKVLKDSGALEVVVAKDAAEKTRIWEARRVAIPALARCRPTLMLEDATVPRSKIPAMLEALDAEIRALENTEILGLAEENSISPELLAELIRKMKADPLPPLGSGSETEVSHHEE